MAIQNSELDFFQIKSQLQTHFEQQSEFSDYDFTASGLSNILDVLAHNTHINALTANMAINESFLTSAQLRSSIVSHAEALGYVPKSKISSTALVSLSITDYPAGPASLTIPVGTEFSASIGASVFTFTTQEQCTALKESNNYVFKTSSGSSTITLKEGVNRSKTFIVDSEAVGAVYVIPDTTIDTSTINVRVYENYLSTNFLTFNDINTVPTITPDSKVFLLRETSNGYYEIFFSDGNILGAAPLANNRIEVDYISTRGSAANGGVSFSTTLTLDGQPITVTTVSGSAGGAEKESSDSIKLNAPRSFSAQNRLVTSSDYTALISSNFGSYIQDVIAWGGNDNIPPQYGKVFASLNFLDDVAPSTQTAVKELIKDQLTSNLSIMSIDTEFVDPQETFLELSTAFNIDPVKMPSSTEALQAQVDAFIKQYALDNLNTFESIFRRSNLLTQVDQLSTAILNSRMSVKVQQRINIDSELEEINIARQALPTPLPILDYLEKDQSVNFPFQLASPDNDDHTVVSSVFKSNGQNVVIKNKLGTTQLQILDLNGIIKVNNAGSYDPAKGTVSMSALRVDEDGYTGTGIKISATPANQSTLIPLRNYIITLDEDLSTTIGFVDNGASKVTL